MSLTRLLIMLVSSLVLLIALVAAYWAYAESNHELEELFDAELAQSTRIVQGLVRYLAETSQTEQLSTTLEDTLSLPWKASGSAAVDAEGNEILPGGRGHKYEKKLAFEVWSDRGTPLLDTLNADDSGGLMPGFQWLESAGYQWRTFTLYDRQTGFWIRSAQRADIREELSRELALGNILPILLALPLLVLATIFAVHTSFRPLRRFEKPILSMAPENIHPLDQRLAPREVRGLVSAINGLLKRLNQALQRERQFSADAAHELRTPLTVLRLHLEQLEDRHPGECRPLMAAVDRMGHLVEQLLVLNRVDAAIDFSPRSHDLAAIVDQSIADVAPLALKKNIEPVFENQAGTALINCNSALINTLLRSIFANAIQYGPADSRVEPCWRPVTTVSAFRSVTMGRVFQPWSASALSAGLPGSISARAAAPGSGSPLPAGSPSCTVAI